MASRFVSGFLFTLLNHRAGAAVRVAAAYPRVNQMRAELAQLETTNGEAQQRNSQIGNEVRDLQEGLEMVEELARQDLGMVKPNALSRSHTLASERVSGGPAQRPLSACSAANPVEKPPSRKRCTTR